MDRKQITWTATSDGWHATVRDRYDRIWEVRISRSEADRTRFTATMLCREPRIYRSDNMAETFSEAQNWCYEQLRLADDNSI